MDVLFYDRKNKRNVKLSQLVRTRLIADLIQGDPQEEDMLKGDLSDLMEREIIDGREFPGILSWHPQVLGEVAYKTEDCPDYMNFDKYCLISDLVFLDLEGV